MRMLMVGLMLCAPAALAADDDDRDDGPGAADALDVGKEVVDHHLDSKSHSERGLLQPEERRLVVKSGMSWEEMKAVREASVKTGVPVSYESGAAAPVRLGAQTSEYGGEAALRHGTLAVGEDAVRLSSWGDDALHAGTAGAGYEMRGGAMAVEGAAARGGYAVESAAFRGGAAIGLADDVARFGARGLLGGGAAAGLGAAALGAGRRRRE
jgi:hypothetical protein